MYISFSVAKDATAKLSWPPTRPCLPTLPLATRGQCQHLTLPFPLHCGPRSIGVASGREQPLYRYRRPLIPGGAPGADRVGASREREGEGGGRERGGREREVGFFFICAYRRRTDNPWPSYRVQPRVESQVMSLSVHVGTYC